MSTMSLALSRPGIPFPGVGNEQIAGRYPMQSPCEMHPPSAATNEGVIIFQPGQAPSVSWIPASFNPGLRRTLRPIDALMEEPEEDEYGLARPTEFAYRSTTNLIRRAASLLLPFPVGSACTDGVAGIRITWRKQTRQIRLVLAPAPEGRSYLYAQVGEHHRITENVTDDTVAAALRWLDQGSEE